MECPNICGSVYLYLDPNGIYPWDLPYPRPTFDSHALFVPISIIVTYGRHNFSVINNNSNFL